MRLELSNRVHNQSSKSGFTLIEVMMALGILGIGMFVLVASHQGSLRLYSSAQDDAMSRLLLERVLGEAELKVMEGELSGEGDFGPRYAGFTYSYKAQLYRDEVPGLFELTVQLMGFEEERSIAMFVFGTGNKWDLDEGRSGSGGAFGSKNSSSSSSRGTTKNRNSGTSRNRE